MNALALADALRPYCYGVATRGHNVTATTDGGKVRIDCRTVTPAHFAILTRGPVRDNEGWSCPLSDFLTATEVSR